MVVLVRRLGPQKEAALRARPSVVVLALDDGVPVQRRFVRHAGGRRRSPGAGRPAQEKASRRAEPSIVLAGEHVQPSVVLAGEHRQKEGLRLRAWRLPVEFLASRTLAMGVPALVRRCGAAQRRRTGSSASYRVSLCVVARHGLSRSSGERQTPKKGKTDLAEAIPAVLKLEKRQKRRKKAKISLVER